jgi:hypothetical protein
MNKSNKKILEDLYDFCNEYNYQLQEEWQRMAKAYKQKITFPAFCVAFYSTLNENKEDDRDNSECL